MDDRQDEAKQAARQAALDYLRGQDARLAEVAAASGGALNTTSTRAGLETSATGPPWLTKPPGAVCKLVTRPAIGERTAVRPSAPGPPAAATRCRAGPCGAYGCCCRASWPRSCWKTPAS